MKFFEIENNIVKPTNEILRISPFKEIWERDFSEKKEMAIAELSYVEFMCSPKSTNIFSGYSPEEKPGKIVDYLFRKSLMFRNEEVKWEPDIMVEDAMKVYKEFLENASPTLSFLDAAMQAAERIKDFFKTVDLTATNPKGFLLYKVADITRGLKDTAEVAKTLHGLRKKVEQELYEDTKTRGNREINHFENDVDEVMEEERQEEDDEDTDK